MKKLIYILLSAGSAPHATSWTLKFTTIPMRRPSIRMKPLVCPD